MPCSIELLILITILFLKSISSELLFEENFDDFDETKWEVIQSEELCKSEFNQDEI